MKTKHGKERDRKRKKLLKTCINIRKDKMMKDNKMNREKERKEKRKIGAS